MDPIPALSSNVTLGEMLKIISYFRFRSNIILFGLGGAVICAVGWAFFPFFNPPKLNWNGIDVDERKNIVVVMEKNFPEWDDPPSCNLNSLIKRVLGIGVTGKSVIVEKINDGYNISIWIRSHGVEEEHARFVLSKSFEVSSTRMRFD